MNQMRKVAIITARGGSTRIPKKNIVSFLGEPLMARVIKACKESNIFDRILVATDDNEIASVAREYGLEVPFKREFYVSDCMHTDWNGNPIEELSDLDRHYLDKFEGLKVPIAEYCLERLEETVNEKFDAFCLLPANSPFITSKTIVDLYEELIENNRDFVITVAKCGKHPWFYCHGSPEDPIPLVPGVKEKNGKKLVLRTQELPEIFIPCSPGFYKAHCKNNAQNFGYVSQDWEVSIDIDTYEDLIWCEKLAKGLDNAETALGFGTSNAGVRVLDFK